MVCGFSTAPDHPDLKVHYFLGRPNKQRDLDHFHNLSNEMWYSVYNSSIDTMERAIKERVFYVKGKDGFTGPPHVNRFKFNELSFHSLLDKLSYHATPLNPRDFVMLFQDRRKIIYQRAVEENEALGFDNKLANIRCFVKREKYNFTRKIDPVPRIIQPRNPRYIVETGRYLKPIEKKIYKNINHVFGHVVVFKGLNAERRGATLKASWDSFRDPVAFGIDASRFDQHVSAAALRWEHDRYKAFYPGDKYFNNLMKLQLSNRAVGFCRDGKLSYRVNRNRMSGDSNTSSGNVLIMCALVHDYSAFKGISIRFANDGDDGVIILERSDYTSYIAGFEDWFLGFGFHMEVEPMVDIFEKISFCQCQPVYDGSSYVMVRDPRVALSKDSLSLKPLNGDKVLRKWCSAVGKGGLTLTGKIPVWQDFYQMFERHSLGATPLVDPTLETGAARMGRGMRRGYGSVSPEARFSFWLAFNVYPDEQIAIEEHFKQYVIKRGGEYSMFANLPINMDDPMVGRHL